MQDANQIAAEPGAGTAPAAKDDTGFIDSAEMLRRLQISRKTLYRWRAALILPSIEIGSKVLYHWPSVQAALLRLQRGA